MAKVRARRGQAQYSEFRRALGKQNLVVAGGILRDFLLGYDNVNYREFERLGFLPALSRYAYLVLLHCVSGPMERSDQSSLIQYAFDNIRSCSPPTSSRSTWPSWTTGTSPW